MLLGSGHLSGTFYSMEIDDLIPYFSISSMRRENIASWDFKQKKNLLIVFFTPYHPESLSLQIGDEGNFKSKDKEKPLPLGGGYTGFTPTDDDVPLLKAMAQGYILIKELNTEILGIAMGKFWEIKRISEK